MAKLTTEDFIRKAREVHGEKYDYSKVEYTGATNKVIIICPEHGEFSQSPDKHMQKRNCPKCNGGVKLTTEEFIQKAKAIHGNKYDYSKVNYNNAKANVIIICPEHGEFEQMASSHLSGKGCSKCGGREKLTTEEFIKRAKTIHGDKYDYSKTKYVDINTSIIICCSIHGEFLQSPNNHLRGAGCPKCGNEKRGLEDRSTTEEFIRRAKAIHGNKYDYSKVNYVKANINVTIICPEHGEFSQRPNDHLRTKGCVECGRLSTTNARKFTTEEFIRRAKAIHGDKYDYSKVNYVSQKVKVIIICPKHGEFEQNTSNHLKGVECPKCHGMSKTTEDFINEAKTVHGEKYDYSKVNYINGKTKIIIICPEHGEFEQQAGLHLSGNGCAKCHGMGKTTEDFINEAKAIHGDKYDYSKSIYVGAHSKVIIICPEHGEFIKAPDKHIHGKQGCPKCNGKGFTFKSLEEVKKIVQQQGIKTQEEYLDWWEKNKKYCQQNGIPKQPDAYYKKNK